MSDNIEVKNYYPDCDAISLAVGGFTIVVYRDAPEDGGETHIEITDDDDFSTTYLILGQEKEVSDARK